MSDINNEKLFEELYEKALSVIKDPDEALAAAEREFNKRCE